MVKPPPYAVSGSTPQQHSEYYLEGGNLIIQVENTLFRVWSTTFRKHSKCFDELLRPPMVVKQRSVPDGTDDEHPLHLQGLKPYEFVCFLWILYPPVFGQYKADTALHWITILELSHRWDFEDIHKLAIKQLAGYKIEAVQKIALQQKYRIEKQWAYESYINLCSRGSPLTSDEAEKLGTQTTALVNQVREKLTTEGRAKPMRVTAEVCYAFGLMDPDMSCCIQ